MLPVAYFVNLAPTRDASLKGKEVQVIYCNSTISEVPCYMVAGLMTACDALACAWAVIVLTCSSCALTPGRYFTSKQKCQLSQEIGSGKDM